MTTVYLGLGSNIGDKVGYIQQAHTLLAHTDGITVERSSSLYETEPYGKKDQEWYVNAVLELTTEHNPELLLTLCQRIEDKLGRTRNSNEKWGPRTIDIDILFYDQELISTNHLQIPHYELHNRAFALVPMLELNPDFVHPVMGKTIAELHKELTDPEEVYLYGTKKTDV